MTPSETADAATAGDHHPAHLAGGRFRVLAVTCEDKPGVLERVASQIRRRGFNIASLSVGPTTEGESRMTLTVDAGHAELDQVGKQLDKLIEVIQVEDITDEPLVSRELVLARVKTPTVEREALVGRELVLARVITPTVERDGLVDRVARLGGRVIDVHDGHVTFELAADSGRVDDLLEMLEPHGLTEIVRSGPLAMRRTPNQ